MIALVTRHIKVFTRDKAAFYLSFLSVAILIVVYKMFLGQYQIDAINEAMGTTTVNQDVSDMVNYWLIAGLVTITSMTATLGGYGVIISDREQGKGLDFQLTAVSSATLQMSYIISAIIIGTMTTFFTYVLGVLLFLGGETFFSLGIKTLALVLGNILASTLLSILMIYPFCRLITSTKAFATFSTIIGTIIGFVSGTYVSIGSVSPILGKIMAYFPLTQINALMKKILMEDSLSIVYADAPSEVVENYRQNYGVDLSFNAETMLTAQQMVNYLVMLGCALLLFNSFFTKIVKPKKVSYK